MAAAGDRTRATGADPPRPPVGPDVPRPPADHGVPRPPEDREGPAPRVLGPSDLAGLAYGPDGLVPVVAQDRATGAVLMLAWADQESLRRSLEIGRMTYWSRSRREMWEKGATSGHTQRLVELRSDCDHDAVLAVVEQEGPACHTGTGTCWSDDGSVPVAGVLGELDRLVAARRDTPEGRYTDTLLAEPSEAAAKVEEEAAELGRVVRGQDNDDPLEHEAADLMYHAIVALHAAGGSLRDVVDELVRRRH